MNTEFLPRFVLFTALGLIGVISMVLYTNLPFHIEVVDCLDENNHVINELTCNQEFKDNKFLGTLYAIGLMFIMFFLGTFVFGLLLLISWEAKRK